jgi:hypothetical protein
VNPYADSLNSTTASYALRSVNVEGACSAGRTSALIFAAAIASMK